MTTRCVLRLCTALVLSICVVGGANGQLHSFDPPDPPICDRSQEVQDDIIAALSGINNCSEITAVSQIDTRPTSLTPDRAELKPGDFDDLHGLSEIAAVDVQNSALPEGLLDDLPNLESFSITGSSLLVNLPDDLFRNNRILTRISFRDNELETLPEGLFDRPAGFLDSLDLEHNPFGLGIPFGIFDHILSLGLTMFRIDLTAMIGALPEEVILTATESSTTIELRPAFIRSPNLDDAIIENADSYEITAADPSVAATRLNNHRLTITLAGGGQTTITIVGGHSGQSAMQTLIVEVPSPEPPVCERTLQVQTTFLDEVSGVSDCADLDIKHLAAINRLDLSSSNIETLRSGDFNNLIGLTELDLSDNDLQTLPEDIFDPISETIAAVNLQGNPFGDGLPLAVIETLLTADNVNLDFAAVRGALPERLDLGFGNAMDLDLEDAFIAMGGGASSPADSYDLSITEARAETTADTPVIQTAISNHILTITSLADGQATITITAAFGGRNAAQTLTVNVAPLVCERTQQVRNAIVAGIDGVSNCAEITSPQLASIEILDLSDQSIETLRSGDFNGLAGLTGLDLSDNDLQTLPADIFDQIPETITSINLQGNPFGDGLPLAVIEKLQTADSVNLALTAVQDVLSTQLDLVLGGDPETLNLRDAFFYAEGSTSAVADSYEINVSTDTVITVAENNHLLTITPVGAGQAELQIAGIREEQRAVHTLTVQVTYPAPDPPVCERSRRVRQVLVSRIVGVSSSNNCREITSAAQLISLAKLTVELSSALLQEGDFNDLSGLSTLELRGLDNTSLPAGLFDDMVSLRKLDIAGGSLVSVPADLFRNNRTLSILELRMLALATLPSGLFDGLELRRLHLEQNPFNRGIPFDIFDGLPLMELGIDLTALIGALPEEVILTTAEAESSTTIDLMSAFISSPDSNDAVIERADSYEITAADPSVATAQLSNHNLTITLAGSGETIVTIVGSRSGQTAMQTIKVEAPVVEPPLCDRTEQVHTLIVAAVAGVSDCSDLHDNRLLTGIKRLDFSSSGIETLKSGDFNNLPGLTELDLSDNDLQTLPADIFASIPETTVGINLQGNPFGDGLPLAVIEKLLTVDNASLDFAAVLGVLPAQLNLGFGDEMELDLEDAFIAIGGSASTPADSYALSITEALALAETIADASVIQTAISNHILTITPLADGQATITITAALGGRNATQTLTVNVAPSPPVCERTAEVQTAIVDAIDDVSDCAEITSVQLASIESLDFSDESIETLRAGDFNNLTGLTELDLSDNDLQTLPEDIFDQIPATVASINLQGNPFGDGLPLAVIEKLQTVDSVNLDLAAVQDVLSTQLDLVLGDGSEILNLRDAFFYADGTIRANADSYEINVSTDAVITAEEDNHILTITLVGAGQTELQIAGIREEQRAIHTLTVQVTYPVPDPPVCDRTQQVQAAIVAAIAGVSDCADVTGARMAATTVLDLQDMSTTELQSGDFAGLTNPSLELTINAQLQTLPADIFAGISPRSINLGGNPFGGGLPPALIDDLSTRTGTNIVLDLVFVRDTLPASLALTVGSAREMNLEDAFFYAAGENTRSPADSYEITVGNDLAATAMVSDHTLTITAVNIGQTDIDVAGVRTSPEQRATQTLTVKVQQIPYLIFRIKVFLEGAQ